MLGFFILGFCVLKYLHQRRVQRRLRDEVKNLLFEYVPLDEESDIEVVNFTDDPTTRNSSRTNNKYVALTNKNRGKNGSPLDALV
jgi:hypothetical protein